MVIRALAIVATLLVAFAVDAPTEAQADRMATLQRAGVGHVVDADGAAGPLQTDAWIGAEADFLSRRLLTVVCAANAQDWAHALAEAGFPPAQADEYYGFSRIREGEMHLSPYVCEGLRLGASASTRRSNDLQVAWSVNVLVHESTHMGRSNPDEALAEARARAGLPLELHRLYGIAYHSAEMSRLTSAATWFRRTEPPAYHGGTCSPAAE
jgi:hypothetical protein